MGRNEGSQKLKKGGTEEGRGWKKRESKSKRKWVGREWIVREEGRKQMPFKGGIYVAK